MFQNGEKLNRYARQRRHIDEQKRKATPVFFSSYESYVLDEMRKNAHLVNVHPDFVADFQKRVIGNGGREAYQKYWKSIRSYRHELKAREKRLSRANWRKEKSEVMTAGDYESGACAYRRGYKASDRWAFE